MNKKGHSLKVAKPEGGNTKSSIKTRPILSRASERGGAERRAPHGALESKETTKLLQVLSTLSPPANTTVRPPTATPGNRKNSKRRCGAGGAQFFRQKEGMGEMEGSRNRIIPMEETFIS